MLLGAGVVALIASRAAHLDLVWVEEAYGMAAAAELLRGKRLYADLWFDKPPLYAWFYTLCGAQYGWPLRLLGIAYLLLCIWALFLVGRRLWDARTGMMAAALASLALTFWIPSAVMAVAPDLLMLGPHALAVWAVASGRPAIAGALAGVALLCNGKALLLLPVLIAWDWRRGARTLAGFLSVTTVSLLALPAGEYWRQVWWWGARYAADSFVESPAREFLVRSGGWAWFHLTAAVGTTLYLWRSRDWRVALWIIASGAAVVAGSRFFPRYYFALLPVAVLAGARGLLLTRSRWRAILLSLLLIPAVRFGPRYVQGSSGWSDAAMMEDSRAAAALTGPGSVFVWGYRPDVYVFSRRPAGTPFLDSQPLTGVLADRHLSRSRPTLPEVARTNRAALLRTSPDYIVDGLGPLNPELAIARYPDLAPWLAEYEEIGRTAMSVVFRRRPDRGPSLEKR